MQNRYYNDELYHYGRKGMKWGQHIYGKVKLAGNTVKRASKKVYDYQKARTARKRAEKELKSAGRTRTGAKKMSEMSNEELAKAIERARLEDTYAQLRPQQVSKGKRFVNDVLNKAVVPAITEAGRQTLQNYLTKAGTNAIEKSFKVPPSEMDKLKKQYDKLKLQSDIEELKLGGGKNWKNLTTKQQYEKTEADRKAAKAAKEAEENAKKEAKTKAEKDTKTSEESKPKEESPKTETFTYNGQTIEVKNGQSWVDTLKESEMKKPITTFTHNGQTIEVLEGQSWLDEILKK